MFGGLFYAWIKEVEYLLEPQKAHVPSKIPRK